MVGGGKCGKNEGRMKKKMNETKIGLENWKNEKREKMNQHEVM